MYIFAGSIFGHAVQQVSLSIFRQAFQHCPTNTIYNWKPVFFTSLLEISIDREGFGGSKEVIDR